MSSKIESTLTKKLHEKSDSILDDIESILCHLKPIFVIFVYLILDDIDSILHDMTTM